MKEVSCRAVDLVLRHLDTVGADHERLLAGVPYSLAHLRDKNERIEWSAYVAFMRNTRAYLTPDDYATIGGTLARSPIFKVFGVFVRALFTLRDFYRWVASPSSGGGNQLFTCIEGGFEDVEKGHCLVRASIKDGYEECPEFFLISKGSFETLPLVLGLPVAVVRFTQDGRKATYDVHYQPSQSVFAWIRHALVLPFSVRAAANELKDAHETLQTRYHQLEAAKNVIGLQATQLQTAHTISQVVLADLDLGRTLEAVVDALTKIAHFRGACLSLAGERSRETMGGDTDGEPDLLRPLEARGRNIGQIAVWFETGADAAERAALIETVLPTVSMALDGAVVHADLLDAQAHLEQRVKDRTADLVSARDDLQKSYADLETSEKARTRIFANVNHEIRTPLTLILMSVEELRRSERFSGDDDRALVAVARNARKLLRLVDGLLLLAAGDEKKLGISPAEVDLARLVTEVVDGFAASARGYGITLVTEAEPNLTAEVDEVGFERILSNLVSNAVKFTPPDGTITVSLSAVGPNVVLTVRDTGIGVSEAFLARAFGRFEQDGRPVRPGGAGSGIGLSIVRDLARAHHGDATVERLEVGTLFRVWMPLVAAAGIQRIAREGPRVKHSTPSDFGLSSGEKPAPRVLSARHEHTILVVEDDDELRARIVDVLAAHHRVLSASTGEQALEIAAAQRPALLVSDVGLPGIDGFEVTRRFRALDGNRIAPVLLLTAFGTIEDRLSGFEAGAVDYMTKPFEPTELIARVAAHLERRRLALQLHESEKLAAIGTMSSGLAHEMRNPANALINAIDPLIELLPPEVRAPDTAVADLLGIIKDCGAQIALLSRQLLGFRRGTEVAREEVRADVLVERALGILRPALRNAELRLDFGYKGEVSCAPALLLQVLGNLLDNAAHAAHKAKGPAWVAISTFAHDGRFVCEVADSGAGVPIELRERIFEPFFTTKAPGEGTGLGLSTSRQIVDRHDGALYVRATDEGSVFRLEIPLSPRDSKHAIASG